jgi:hypothetical protein
MENTMSKEANALLRKLLVSGIDATAFHCAQPTPTPTPDDPSKPYPPNPRDD